MRRIPLFGLAPIVAALVGTACGGSSAEEPCARLAPAYTDLITQLVDREGSRDPAGFGPEFAELARWWPNVRVVAWLSDALTTAEIDSLVVEVGLWEGVTDVAYFTEAAALQEFRELFAEQPELIAAVEADPSVLPASLRATVPAADVEAVTQRLAASLGVMKVSSASDELRDLRRQAVAAAIRSSGLAEQATEIAGEASESGCAWGELARAAGLDGLDPGGVVGEWIIAEAWEGLPLEPVAP